MVSSSCCKYHNSQQAAPIKRLLLLTYFLNNSQENKSSPLSSIVVAAAIRMKHLIILLTSLLSESASSFVLTIAPTASLAQTQTAIQSANDDAHMEVMPRIWDELRKTEKVNTNINQISLESLYYVYIIASISASSPSYLLSSEPISGYRNSTASGRYF